MAEESSSFFGRLPGQIISGVIVAVLSGIILYWFGINQESPGKKANQLAPPAENQPAAGKNPNPSGRGQIEDKAKSSSSLEGFLK